MLRHLLTILALISGLAGLAEPVQAARIAADVATTSEAEQGVPCQRARVVLQLDGEQRSSRATRGRGCPPVPRAVAVPAVYLQADRARE